MESEFRQRIYELYLQKAKEKWELRRDLAPKEQVTKELTQEELYKKYYSLL